MSQYPRYIQCCAFSENATQQGRAPVHDSRDGRPNHCADRAPAPAALYSIKITRHTGANMDEDLNEMSRESLVSEVVKLRNGIRAHRDSSGHDLCWYHPELWGLLPEKTDPLPSVPEWPRFMEGCLRYRQSLDVQAKHATRTDESYEEKE